MIEIEAKILDNSESMTNDKKEEIAITSTEEAEPETEIVIEINKTDIKTDDNLEMTNNSNLGEPKLETGSIIVIDC